MIELYYWTTPNGHKITILLEELGMPYTISPINISEGDQFSEKFLKISPNNKIPAIIDLKPDEGGKPLSIFESGAILLYLADKTRRFIPQDLQGRYKTLEWLFWQMAGLGPMSGQNNHFSHFAKDKIPYAIDRYSKEVNRLYTVLDKQLENNSFISGEYSIADIACYPWILIFEALNQDLNEFKNLKRWFLAIGARPAVQRAYLKAKEINKDFIIPENIK